MRQSIELRDVDFYLLLKRWNRTSTTDAIKTASKRAIQKTTEATGDLIGNKIADKIISVSRKSSRYSQNDDANKEIEAPKKRYISLEKRQIFFDELKLV